tara:strand:+ start:456 stop:875 length:420 start_codon:yes stop_codon:yes gene_type:complete
MTNNFNKDLYMLINKITKIQNDIEYVNKIKLFVNKNYPIYLEDNLIIKNLSKNIKDYIYISINSYDLNKLKDDKIRTNSEKYLPKIDKFSIIYNVIKLSKSNNSSVATELNKFYDNIHNNDSYMKNLAYYMTLTYNALN